MTLPIILLLMLTFLGGCSRNIRPASVPILPATIISPIEQPPSRLMLCMTCELDGNCQEVECPIEVEDGLLKAKEKALQVWPEADFNLIPEVTFYLMPTDGVNPVTGVAGFRASKAGVNEEALNSFCEQTTGHSCY